MAQLDRVLPRLDSRAVSEVVLEADAPIRCVSRAGAQPVTQQPLTRQQVLALVAEVSPISERAAIMVGTDVHVRYALGGREYVFAQDATCETLRIVIRLADEARTVWVESSVPQGGASRPAEHSMGDGVITAPRSLTPPAAARPESGKPTTVASAPAADVAVTIGVAADASVDAGTAVTAQAPIATTPDARAPGHNVAQGTVANDKAEAGRGLSVDASTSVVTDDEPTRGQSLEDTPTGGPATGETLSTRTLTSSTHATVHGDPPETALDGIEVPRVNWRLRAGDRVLGPFTTELDARGEMERLLRLQVERKAADLHLRIGEPPIMRAGGDLVRMNDESILDEARLMAMLLSIMPDKNRDEFDANWDTDFAHEITGLSRFRVNALKDRNGAAAVMRTIASETVTVEQMGITTEVQQLCQLTKGLVLVTGPTGSGKSTTLCALVDLVNRTRKDHIITIEDPIEFVHQSKQCLITQRQVGVHTQSFKSALRAALREDPDIIMVGELRDLETIAIALETAETGHLVFGTLHTSTAASTINRIVDQFPADRQDQIKVMLAESLKGVISQTLCKKIGGGRVAAREILLVNKAVSALIRESKTVQINNIIQTQRKMGMETLNDALLTLVKNKSVEASEAYVKSVEKKDMALKLRALGHDMSAYTSEE